MQGKGGVNCCGWCFRYYACCGVCSSLLTLVTIVMFCMDSNLDIHPVQHLAAEYEKVTTQEELMKYTGYEGSINNTVMPNFRAIATNVSTAADGAQMTTPIGYIDLETDDGFVLLAIFVVVQVFTMWNSCLCWSAGSIGINMTEDAESIVSTKSGQINQHEDVDLASIPLSGTGKVPFYSRKFRGVCNSLMATMIALSCVNLAHQYMKADFMDKALTAEYGQPYLNWRQNYEHSGYKAISDAIAAAKKDDGKRALSDAVEWPSERDLKPVYTAVGAGGDNAVSNEEFWQKVHEQNGFHSELNVGGQVIGLLIIFSVYWCFDSRVKEFESDQGAKGTFQPDSNWN